VLSVGSYSSIASFTPTDSTDYTGTTATVTLLVNQATPTITWTAPTAITYGTALGSTQLDATSSVPGAFTYSLPAGTVLNAGSHSLTVTFSPADSKDYAGATAAVTLLVNQATPTINWPTPAAVAYGGALSATQLDAATSVAGSFTYSPSAGTILSVGAHPLLVSFAPTDSADYTTASSTVSLTVSKATPAVSLVSFANAVFVSNAVVFTANVSSPVISPTGSVTFFDGTTSLGPATVTAGTAALSISSLGVGPHSITATYSGDSNFNTLTTPSLTETIQDFSIAVSGSSSTTASPGGSAVYALVVNPLNGNTLPGSITFAVSGLPPGATAVFAPAVISANSAATNVTLTVNLSSEAASQPAHKPLNGGIISVALGFIVLPFVGRSRRTSIHFLFVALITIGGAISIGTLSSCGGGGSSISSPLTPPSYPLTITATAGSLSHAGAATLIVQ
jgi:hypothetical protein